MNRFQNTRLKSSIFTRNVVGAPTLIDLNTMVSFNDKSELEATLRLGGNYAGIAQLNITDTLKFGWTYAVNLNLKL